MSDVEAEGEKLTPPGEEIDRRLLRKIAADIRMHAEEFIDEA